MRKTIAELQEAGVERATPAEVGINLQVKEDAPDKKEATLMRQQSVRQLAEYLEDFSAGRNCPSCDALIRPKNMLEGFLLSTFEWGVAHGEGRCSECGYPVRGIHLVEMKVMGEPATFEFRMPLPYHPSVLEDKE